MRRLRVILQYLEKPLLVAALIIVIWLFVAAQRQKRAEPESRSFDYYDLAFVQRSA